MLASHGNAICHEHHDKRIVASHGNFQEFLAQTRGDAIC